MRTVSTALTLMALALVAQGAVAQEPDAPPAGLSTLPEVVEFVQAPFPELALEDEVQADVMLSIQVTAEGTVAAAQAQNIVLYIFDDNDELYEEEVTPEYDPYGFGAAAEAVLLQFRFSPALDDAGEAVPVELIWRYGFYFEEEEVETDALVAAPGEVVLRGQLIGRIDALPLNGVEVTVTSGDVSVTAVTNVDGIFELADLAPGDWTVTAEPDDREPILASETIVPGQRTEVVYRVERLVETDYSFEVREDAIRREVSRQTLSVSEIVRVPGNNGDVIKVVQNLPGFARSPFNGGLIVIRGSSPEDSRVYIDGVFVPLIFHFGGLTSVLASDVIEEIEYIPGAFSVEYGRATGGVINASTRAPSADEYHAAVDVDVFDAGIFVEGPIADDWSFFAAGRRSYIDAILPAVIPEDSGFNLTVAPRYWDYQGRIQWDPSPRHQASLRVFGSDDAVSLILDEPPQDPAVRGGIETNTQFHRVLLTVDSDLSDSVHNRFALSGGTQNLSFFLGEEFRFVLTSQPLTLRDRVDYQALDNLALRAGLDIDLTRFDLSIRAPRPPKEGEVPVIIGSSEVLAVEREGEWFVTPAIWLEAEWDVIEGLTLVPGLRGDLYSDPAGGSIDGRLSARYDITDQWTVKGAVGTFHEPPQPEESSPEFGNPDIGLEWAMHYVAGAEYSPLDYLDIDLQLFYKDLFDLVARSDDTVERDGETVAEVYDNRGRGRVYGAELLVRHQLANDFFGWVSYTLSRSERRDSPEEAFRTFAYDQTHILAVVASYEFGRGWSAGARFRYVTGNPFTPIVGSVYDADADSYVRIAGEPGSERNGDFHQLDVRIDKVWTFPRWQLNWYLDIQNVYNRANPEALNYSFDFSETAVISGLPIIPSLGLRGSF